jgi:hypothetical protein
MHGSSEATTAGPVERFKPTTGFIVGYFSLAFVALVLVFVVFSVHTTTGLRVGVAMVFAAALIWATQIRPRAAAYADRVVLKNSFQDTTVPLLLVDDVSVGTTLNVWAGEKRYVCIGIGESRISQRKKTIGQPSLLGSSRAHEFSERADRAAPDQVATTYAAFVVRRIEELAEQAKRRASAAGPGEAAPTPVVTQAYAVAEIAALAVSALAFVVTLFL